MKSEKWTKHVKIEKSTHNINKDGPEMAKNSLAHPTPICYYPDRQGPVDLVDKLCTSPWFPIPRPYLHLDN